MTVTTGADGGRGGDGRQAMDFFLFCRAVVATATETRQPSRQADIKTKTARITVTWSLRNVRDSARPDEGANVSRVNAGKMPASDTPGRVDLHSSVADQVWVVHGMTRHTIPGAETSLG